MNPLKSNSRSRGWTMIELAVTLLVLAILAAIAYPAFTNQIIKARRADGYALLYHAAQRQQQYYTANTTYTSTIGNGGLNLSTTSTEGYYTLSVTSTNTTYTLTATRVAPQTADTLCGDLTLTHLGAKGNSGGSWSASKCW